MEELLEEKKFEMRAYDKAELALLYCPGRSEETALKTMMRWIRQCEPLMEALDAIGYNCRRHRFLRREVEQIVRHLGDPRKEGTKYLPLLPYIRLFPVFSISFSRLLYFSFSLLVLVRSISCTSQAPFQYFFSLIPVLVPLHSGTCFPSLLYRFLFRFCGPLLL